MQVLVMGGGRKGDAEPRGDSGDVKAVVEDSIQDISEGIGQNIPEIDRAGISKESKNWRQEYSTELKAIKKGLQGMAPDVFRRFAKLWSNEEVGRNKLALYIIVGLLQQQLSESHVHAFRLVTDIEEALGEVADGETSLPSVAREALNKQKELADSFFEEWFNYLQKSKVASSKGEGQTDNNIPEGEKDKKEKEESQNLYKSLLEDYRRMGDNYKEIERIFRELEGELKKDETLVEKIRRRIEEVLLRLFGGN